MLAGYQKTPNKRFGMTLTTHPGHDDKEARREIKVANVLKRSPLQPQPESGERIVAEVGGAGDEVVLLQGLDLGVLEGRVLVGDVRLEGGHLKHHVRVLQGVAAHAEIAVLEK